jgi:hypothetical protein
MTKGGSLPELGGPVLWIRWFCTRLCGPAEAWFAPPESVIVNKLIFFGEAARRNF